MSSKPAAKPSSPTTSNATAEIVAVLTEALAETSVAQMKAQNFHWNVTGMAFGPLHDLFGRIYTEHFAAIDELAERIKALGAHAEGRYGAYLELSKIRESDGKGDARTMLRELAADQKQLSATFQRLAEVAEKHEDIATNDLAVGRIEAHDKFAWMLSAHLDG